MLADELDYVVGVDPHRDAHALAVVMSAAARWCSRRTSPRDSGGYAEALRLARAHAPGRRVFAIEGTGSFGAGLTRFLAERGERVFEVGRLRRERRSGGKTDALDAIRAARSVLGQTRPATPRAGGEREALRALMVAREGAADRQAGRALPAARRCSSPHPSRCAASCGRSPARGCSGASRRPVPSAGRTRSCAARCSRCARSPAASQQLTRRGARTRTRDRDADRASSHRSYSTSPASARSLAAQVVISWSHPGRVRQRSRLRPPRRRRPDPRLVRPNDPPPPRPRRRPPTQPRAPH